MKGMADKTDKTDKIFSFNLPIKLIERVDTAWRHDPRFKSRSMFTEAALEKALELQELGQLGLGIREVSEN